MSFTGNLLTSNSRIESVLSILPMPHKTILTDSKVYQTIEKWSKDSANASKDEGIESAPMSRATSPIMDESRCSSPEEKSNELESMEVDQTR